MKLATEQRAGPGSGCPLIVHLTVGGGCPSVRHASCIASSAAATTSLGGLPSSQRGGPVPYHTNLHIYLIAEQRCKKILRFFILVTFFTFLTFFSQTCLFLKKNVGKVQSGKQINKKHFQNNSNEIDLWFFCYLLCLTHVWMAYSELPWRPFLGHQAWSWTTLRRANVFSTFTKRQVGLHNVNKALE